MYIENTRDRESNSDPFLAILPVDTVNTGQVFGTCQSIFHILCILISLLSSQIILHSSECMHWLQSSLFCEFPNSASLRQLSKGLCCLLNSFDMAKPFFPSTYTNWAPFWFFLSDYKYSVNSWGYVSVSEGGMCYVQQLCSNTFLMIKKILCD